jgi:hypothetical protein
MVMFEHQNLAHENQLPRIPSVHGPWKLATWPFFIAWNRSHEVFHENNLPCICSMNDTGVKMLSMKINYFAPFKHKHKHQKLAHENLQSSLFSWITLWHLCHTLNRGQVPYFHETLHESYSMQWATSHSFVALDRSHDIFHKNKLPYICSMYDTGFKVLSMKIKYFAPFKHKLLSEKWNEGMRGS